MATKETIIVNASNQRALARLINDQHKAGYEISGGIGHDGSMYLVPMSRSTDHEEQAPANLVLFNSLRSNDIISVAQHGLVSDETYRVLEVGQSRWADIPTTRIRVLTRDTLVDLERML